MTDDFGRDTQGGVDVGGTTLLEEETRFLEPGDHERFSHFVRKEKIVESAVMGSPVTALCGKIWVPSRDPQKFPVCPTCKEIYEGLRPEPEGEGGGTHGGSGSGGGAGE